MKQNAVVPAEALEKQRDFACALRDMLPQGGKYHIVTLGCQMNVRDSETIAGMLEEMGLSAAATREEADLVLYNTCCVRENAENKALGNVIWLKELKKDKPDLLICVGGCMMQEEGVADRLRSLYPFIDVIFGTHNAYKLPELIYRAIMEKRTVAEIEQIDGEICEGLPVKRGDKVSAFVSVMYGCNNFCSYCIVPYVRGRERSREPEAILDEVKALRDQGVMEVTLLGQNVNSYGGGGRAFAELLRRVDEIGIPRIRFMTSHPKDLSDELIDAIATLPRVMKQLHLPVQSGNDRILSLMNRRYTRDKYLALVDRLRAACPDIGLTSDIIVGFPGETEAEFEDTLSLVERVRYDAAFTFIYSKRAGTVAAKMPDDTPYEEKSRRIQRLIDVQQTIGAEALAAQVGMTLEVLADGHSTREARNICGKTERGHMVNFAGEESDIGRLMRVKICSAGKNTLRGEQI